MIPDEIKRRIEQSKRVCVFTGAGVSAESGIPTFRDSVGLWENYRAEDLVTPEAFRRDPVTVWRWHVWLQGLSYSAQPNAAHRTISEMDKSYPEFLLITQNIDDLHERAGTERMVKLHGDIMTVRCLEESHVTRLTIPLDQESITSIDTLPRCPECGGRCRPDVVWFGELLPVEPLDAAVDFSSSCDLLVIVGTSGTVSGGYGFTEMAKRAGAFVIEVNPEDTFLTPSTDLRTRVPAAQALPEMFTKNT